MGMRQEAVRAVDGRADGRGTEKAVCRADGRRDGGCHPSGGRSADGWGDGGGRPLGDRLHGRPPAGRSQGRTPIETAASIRRAVELVDGCLGKTAVRRAVGYADGERTTRRTGRQTSTSRNGHLQHREYKTPPSARRSGFYPGVKLMKF